jgi:hypothetical protein
MQNVDKTRFSFKSVTEDPILSRAIRFLFVPKRSLQKFGIGLALLMGLVANQVLAQATPAQIAGSDWEALTVTSPAVASDGHNLYAAWKDFNSNNIYFSYNYGFGWTSQQIVTTTTGTPQTAVAPALSYIQPGDQLVLGYADTGSGEINLLTWNGSSWNGPFTIAGAGWAAESKYAPAIIGGGDVGVAWVGLGEKNDIWYSVLTQSGGWSTQLEVKGSGWQAQSSAAPAALTTFNKNLVGGWIDALFWKGNSGDGIWDSMSPPNWAKQAAIQDCSPDTDAGPTAAQLQNVDEPAPATVLLVAWKKAESTTINYGVYPFFWYSGKYQCGQVAGSGWSASTNVAPAVANGLVSGPEGNTSGNIFAWTDAVTSRIFYVDPVAANFAGLAGFPE